MTEQQLGRRERKKAALRQRIADVALELFLARGFDAVSVTEVAEAADVARTTLFAHFPTKEALVFDREPQIAAALVAAVRDREPGLSMARALQRGFEATFTEAHDQPGFAAFQEMVRSSPSLVAYEEAMWRRQLSTLADAIAADLGVTAEDHPECTVLAWFAIDALALASRHPRAAQMFEHAFRLLDQGWAATEKALRREAPAAR